MSTEYEYETEIGEQEVIVHFDYQPQERQTLEYPGCDASVTINAVILGGVLGGDDIQYHLSDIDLGELEDQCIQSIFED